MKKGLLLSVVASTVIFAGGDIAPVEPAQPASADFWGLIGISYEMNDNDVNFDLSDEENNGFSTTVVLGVEKELGNGFGFGVEVAGWSDFGFDIADNPRVDTTLGNGMDQTDAEVSQAYLTYGFGNTAIKAGRQALPKAVSPWAWTDTSAGVKDITYDAIVVVNTDLTDTTLVGAWVANAVNGNEPTHLGDNKNGIFMATVVNKSLENTTITASAYYFADANYDIPGIGWALGEDNGEDLWSIWASVESSADGFGWGVQTAYVDGDFAGLDASLAIEAKVTTTISDINLGLYAGYLNDGDYSFKTAGSGVGTSALWTNSLGGSMGADAVGYDQTHIRATASYHAFGGRVWGELAYFDYDGDLTGQHDNTFGGRIGYDFTVAGIDVSIQYRAWSEDYVNAPTLDKQRVRIEAFYKF